MIPFLKNVAKAYYTTYGKSVSDFTFVFPSRRAGIFFQKYLGEIAGKPLFSPQVLTLQGLFEKLNPLKIADRIEMLFILYDVYRSISKTTESFDEFLFWGEIILNDFNDIDKWMADARQLFQNIQDLKEIDAGFSYLEEEQVAAIRRFWASFIPIGESERKKDFIEIWEVLFELYSRLKLILRNRNLAYEGMLCRELAEKIQAKEDIILPFEKIIFVGLNAQTKAEEILLTYLHRQGLADFYWDYSSDLIKDPDNKASWFIKSNKASFPSGLSLEAEELPLEKPVVEAIGIPSFIGQAKHTYSILKSLVKEKIINRPEDTLKTAVILPDENLLLPVLYSIPPEIEKINVTMGYSLSNSSVSGLMEHIFNVQRNIRMQDGNIGYYFRFVLSVLNHKYIVNIAGEEVRNLRLTILQYNKIVVFYEELRKNSLLEIIFKPIGHWREIAGYLKNILARLQVALLEKRETLAEENYSDALSADVEREFIIEYYKTINKMEEALRNVDAEMSVETYFRLLRKLVNGISVPFRGEPVAGLQVMGMLETRALDFENIIILSMNEGIFPQRKYSGSFIPYNLRRGFGLPTHEQQDCIYSYHFYRLINRARRIYLLYDTRTEGLQTGEVSRYFHQLKYLYPHYFDIREKFAIYEVSSMGNKPISIQKEKHIIQKLDEFLCGQRSLSASSINMYLDCPLQFYFSVIENMQEEDEVAEMVEASMFGNIFHSVMEWLYKPFEGKTVTADLLHKIRKDDVLLTRTLERSFAKNYFKVEESKAKPLSGQNYLTAEVLKRYVKKVLQTDARLTPFRYIQSEKRIATTYQLKSGKRIALKGFIDRIDEVNGRIRIIDYKTGKGILHYKNMPQLFDKVTKDRPKAVMQVFMYAYLYSLENPDKVLEPGIYFLRNLFDEKFDPCVFHKPSPKEMLRIDNFNSHMEEFSSFFENCLEEIFDPDNPFDQTPNGKACEWCNFTSICKK